MPGLTGLNFSQIVYGTDNVGVGGPEAYKEDERFWTATHSAMGRSKEDLERYFYRNAAGLLKIE